MLKKLRIKFILINMLLVTVILSAVFGFVYHFTRVSLEDESVSMMQSIAEDPLYLMDIGEQGGSVRLPYFILKINVIPVLVQVLVVYLILAINILTVGYFTYIYDFYYNSKLVIATLITLAIGLGIIILVFYFLQRRSNKSLNDNLKHFKERDKDEETR